MSICRPVRRSARVCVTARCTGSNPGRKEYRGDLGIALSDVYGMDAFLRDFDLYFCKLFDGARHDSGDPFCLGRADAGALPSRTASTRCTKTLIFSDGLTVPRTIELYRQFQGRCQLAFGIGTNLTNDLGYEPLQIVIKMVRCNGQPVAKLSDTPRQEHVRRRKIPGLPAPGVRHSLAAQP
jgi:nicotinate phosphoribosyltransferase